METTFKAPQVLINTAQGRALGYMNKPFQGYQDQFSPFTKDSFSSDAVSTYTLDLTKIDHKKVT